MAACSELVGLLATPERASRTGPGGWDRVVRVARRAGVLARLAVRLDAAGVAVPCEVRRHMDADLRIAAAHHGNVRWEVRRIAEALGSAGLPFMLLKGAAYVIAGSAPARGRIFEDVDILVRQEDLGPAESALGIHGWVTTHRHPYDQRYYRTWMHELPPMRHVRRGCSLDVHHRLLPRTAPLQPDPELLWASARTLPGWSGVRVPCDTDLVLHAVAHLFADGAFENGLRDLVDIDDLLRTRGHEPGFWPQLRARAAAMDLERPLADALAWSHGLLGTPVPAAARPPRGRHRRFGGCRILDTLFAQGLRPEHPLCSGAWNRTARALLYLRSHRLRMPVWRVLPHLARKAIRPLEASGH